MFTFITPIPTQYAVIATLINDSSVCFRELDVDLDYEFETAQTIQEMSQTKELLCAYHEGILVGFAAFRVKNSQTVWLSSLYIDQKSQGKGIGSALLAEVEHWARGKGALVLVLETDARAYWARGFYEKMGYHILSDEMMKASPWDMILDKPQVVGRCVYGKEL